MTLGPSYSSITKNRHCFHSPNDIIRLGKNLVRFVIFFSFFYTSAFHHLYQNIEEAARQFIAPSETFDCLEPVGSWSRGFCKIHGVAHSWIFYLHINVFVELKHTFVFGNLLYDCMKREINTGLGPLWTLSSWDLGLQILNPKIHFKFNGDFVHIFDFCYIIQLYTPGPDLGLNLEIAWLRDNRARRLTVFLEITWAAIRWYNLYKAIGIAT